MLFLLLPLFFATFRVTSLGYLRVSSLGPSFMVVPDLAQGISIFRFFPMDSFGGGVAATSYWKADNTKRALVVKIGVFNQFSLERLILLLISLFGWDHDQPRTTTPCEGTHTDRQSQRCSVVRPLPCAPSWILLQWALGGFSMLRQTSLH